MNATGPGFVNASGLVQIIAQMAMAFWVLGFLVAIVGAVWIYGDAQSRGKSGPAAAVLVLLSAFHGITLLVIVLCAWILIRPEKNFGNTSGASGRQARELPSNIAASSSTSEFLNELGQNESSES